MTRAGLTLACAATLFLGSSTWAQMPPAPGKLQIKSQPTGAQITINGTVITQATDATLVVSPGQYSVSVGTAGGSPYCAATSVTIQANDTKVLVCNGKIWSSSG